MLVAAGGAFAGILALGSDLAPPAGAPGATARGPIAGGSASGFLLALAIVIGAARACGVLFRRWFGQVEVIGEMFAGLALGPSLLGALAPDVHAALFPDAIAGALALVADLGVLLFMFLVGLALDPRRLRGQVHATVLISHASIAVPFLFGAAVALHAYPRHGGAGVPFALFAAFFGISLSITAFPVLARIVGELGLQQTSLGAVAIACAAIGDVTAWTLLAVVAAVAVAEVGSIAATLSWIALFVAGMLLLARPLLARFAAREQRSAGPLALGALALIAFLLLLAAAVTEAIGIHALFGAFLFGAILPHEGRLATQLRARLEDAVLVLFLPCFFVHTGLRTEIGLLSGAADWLLAGLILAAATAGKFGGTLAAARLTGYGWREGSALGFLMNARGLMELIVLNVGLDLGVISPPLFTMLVLMALVTTATTTPAVARVLSTTIQQRRTS
jgi:Kef-type K+ transport system membrane component KefB